MSPFEYACSQLPLAAQSNLERLAKTRKQPLGVIIRQILLDGANLADMNCGKAVAANGRFMRPPEAAEYLGISMSQLSKMRCSGLGPSFVKLSHKVVGYWEADLIAWLASRVKTSTHDTDD